MNKFLYLITLAVKQILRHKVRSLFILSSIILSLTVSLTIISLFEGMFTQIQKAVTDTNTGTYQLQEKNYAEFGDPTSPIQLTEEHLALGGSPELVIEGNIVQPEGSASLIALGVDPVKNLSVIDLGKNLIEGEFLTNPEGVVIGKDLAHKFKLNLGDDLLLNYQDEEGSLRSELLPITGIYQFNSSSFQKTYIYVTTQKLQDLFFTQERSGLYFHRIVLTHKAQFPRLVLKSWKDINPEMNVVINFNKGLLNFFIIIIAITVALSIFNPIRMLLEERVFEFKMMNTIGVSKIHMIILGMIESIIMMIISLSSSFVLFGLILIYLQNKGLNLSGMNNGKVIERAGIELPSIIFPIWNEKQFLQAIVFVLLTIGLTYLYSLNQVIKKSRGAQ